MMMCCNTAERMQVQYPDALPVMLEDLKHIRLAAKYLSRMEINFDLVSAVDELAGQIKLEFDFVREARIMDTIAGHLSVSPCPCYCWVPATSSLSLPSSARRALWTQSLVTSLSVRALSAGCTTHKHKVSLV